MKVLLMTAVLAMSAAHAADKMDKAAANAKSNMTPTQLDDLIRGEMSAVKTYNNVLENIKSQEEKAKLTAIRNDHVNAVSKLKGFASKDVKEDTETIGAWGAFTSAYTSGAKLIGNETALKALSQGEEHGIKEYKEALDDETIKPELKQMIRTQFIPKQEEHIKAIKSFM